MRIKLPELGRVEEREQVMDQDRPASHPLVVIAAAVVVGPIQTRSRKALLEPSEQGFVADMHAQRDLGLAAVTSERALADKQANDHPPLEFGEFDHAAQLYRECVSRSRKS